MKDTTRNKHLHKLLGEGYIIYVPEKDGNGYSLISHNADKDIKKRIETFINYTQEDKNEDIFILTSMLDYDYGHPAYEERRALKQAIEVLKTK